MRGLAFVLLLACSGEPPLDEPADEHGAAIGITRWTGALELYGEHAPAVVDREVEFLAHLTTLRDFRALEEGSATLILEGPATIRAEVTAPTRPGIFVPAFTAHVAGVYRGRLEVRAPGIDDVFDDFTIEVYPNDDDALTANRQAASGNIVFLKEQQWRVRFDTAFACRRTVIPTVEIGGTIDTPPDGSAEVGAAIAGRLVASDQGLPRQGDRVVRGQRLASIAPAPSSPEDAARASLAVAEADARAARAAADLERAERLIADQAISQRELENSRREVAVSEEARRAARRAQQLFSGAANGRGGGSWQLTAPIDGIVTEVNVSPGTSLSAGQVIFRIIDPSELWIRARVPEQDAARLRAELDAGYLPIGADHWRPMVLSGDHANAAILYTGRTVDPESRTVEVVYALGTEDPALRVGGLVRVGVPVGEALDRVAVPRAAVVDDDGRSVVYVQVEGEAFAERIVRVGVFSGEWVTIDDGLEVGERIVVEGAPLVRLSARAPAGMGHGHVH